LIEKYEEDTAEREHKLFLESVRLKDAKKFIYKRIGKLRESAISERHRKNSMVLSLQTENKRLRLQLVEATKLADQNRTKAQRFDNVKSVLGIPD